MGADFARWVAAPDNQIDYSDAPANTDFSEWVRGPFREALQVLRCVAGPGPGQRGEVVIVQ